MPGEEGLAERGVLTGARIVYRLGLRPRRRLGSPTFGRARTACLSRGAGSAGLARSGLCLLCLKSKSPPNSGLAFSFLGILGRGLFEVAGMLTCCRAATWLQRIPHPPPELQNKWVALATTRAAIFSELGRQPAPWLLRWLQPCLVTQISSVKRMAGISASGAKKIASRNWEKCGWIASNPCGVSSASTSSRCSRA